MYKNVTQGIQHEHCHSSAQQCCAASAILAT